MCRSPNTPAVLAITALALLAGGAGAGERLSYNRDIRPILAENCFQCHGPDAKTREADLRLDTRDGATADRDGIIAIVPGDADAGSLLARLTTDDEGERMPPPDAGKRLTAEQIDVLRRWINDGAKYERHWAFEPVVRAILPAVNDTEWCRSPIDRFVLAQLEANKLAPSPEADRSTLIRRVYLDLLGLPPTIDDVRAFTSDQQPGAYERLVERVLASPRFGERWGRHWLDQARYADSNGYTNDNPRTMWPYRDWVIDAVNRDLPFDEFTVEQLAGDLLPEATIDQLVATGFHRNTLINTEGGTKADQFRDEQVKDRTDTTASVWLGLTAGCAKCHDHKYDPISQAEYYQLYAFFNSTADANSITPTTPAPSPQQREELAGLQSRFAELQEQIDGDKDRAARQQAWEASLVTRAKDAADAARASEEQTTWTVLQIDGKSAQSAVLTPLEDQSLLVSGTNGAADEYQVSVRPTLKSIRSIRLEALTHENLPSGGPGRAGNGNFVLSEFWFRTADGRELRFTKAQADHSQPNYDVAGAIDSNTETGWAINGTREGGANHNRVAWFVLPKPLEITADETLTFTLQFNNGANAYNLGRFRISASPDVWVDSPQLDVLAEIASTAPDKRSKPQQQRLKEAFLRSDERLAPLFAELQTVGQARDKLQSEIPTAMVLRELAKPRATHLQIRGDFLREGDVVEPKVPSVLPVLMVESATRDQAAVPPRVAFSRWLTRADNPLTPRVTVNRMWMRLFGRGLVDTDSDFGLQGSLPTHPELLDWLASEMVRQDWSTKAMLRTIVCSSTYRQASNMRGEGVKIDPSNRFLWRQNRLRVEGEIVRDLCLVASGTLSTKIGGPSVYPPQPSGVYAFTQRDNSWPTSKGEDRYRRGMYTFFMRSAPYPLLTTFDAPNFNQTCTRRDRSNTPLQSLTVANDASMFELAQALAAAVQTINDDNERLQQLFARCLSRDPTDAEQRTLATFLQSQRQHFGQHEADAKQLAAGATFNVPPAEAAAWIALARVIMNLDEFITRE